MEKHLATFSGKFGDILWSLPTVRALAEQVQEPIDFCVMPQYEGLVELLQEQSYIHRAFAFHGWECIGSPYGDQPWQCPVVDDIYEKVWHLTYKTHPFGTTLLEFIARQQGVELNRPIPFIEVEEHGVTQPRYMPPYVAYAFNDMHPEEKKAFFSQLQALLPKVNFVDIRLLDWKMSAEMIANAACYVGCRSANYVLAHGVGQKVISYEPHMARNEHGGLKGVFGCKFGTEVHLPIEPMVAAGIAATQIKQWLTEVLDAT